jgi:CheY-like chemotaxis protein
MRPTVIIAEPEHPEGLSTRKLVLETGKYNVLTAYSTPEAIEILDKFPAVEVLALHSSTPGGNCDKVVAHAKKTSPKIYVVLLAASEGSRCQGVDKVLSSHEPQALLQDIRNKFGDPGKFEPEQA